MKRLHVHVRVKSLEEGIAFYSGLFGLEPTVKQHDYAKWMVEDPKVNFAISTNERRSGFDHLGIEVEDEAELVEIEDRLRTADAQVIEQRGANCCYAEGDKSWSYDPDGIAWEAFVTHGQIGEYGADLRPTTEGVPELEST